MLSAILSFVTSLHIDVDSDDFQILSGLQITNLVSVVQHLLAYFALYELAGVLDSLLELKKGSINMFNDIMLPALAL